MSNERKARAAIVLEGATLKAEAGAFVLKGNDALLSVASVLTQAVVSRTGKTQDGWLIEVIAPAWTAIRREIERDSAAIYQIPPERWEEIIAAAYEMNGFDRVVLTPRSGDFGRDVIAEQSGWGSVRFIDQVKAYKPGHVVTAEKVRALGFALLADPGATKGIVTTTSTFAPGIKDDPFIAPYIPHRIELIHGQELVRRLAAIPRA